MKSNVIEIDSAGNGFPKTLEEARWVAAESGLLENESIELQLIVEEMLSMIRSVTGEMKASFWIEWIGSSYSLHVSTRTLMDKTMHSQLISASTSQKNEAANCFLGYLRDVFEKAIISESLMEDGSTVNDFTQDQFTWHEDDPEWDRFEESVLRKLANEIKIDIRGRQVKLTVTRHFDM